MDTKRPNHHTTALAVANVARAAVSASGVFARQKRLDRLAPAIHQTKDGILRILTGYADNIHAQIEAASPVSPLLLYYEHIANLILSIRNPDEIIITADEHIRVDHVEVAPIESFHSLPEHQALILHAVALHEFLKTPPYRMPGQNLGDLNEEMRGTTRSFDQKAFLGWLTKKRQFDGIMSRLSQMEFSKNGTLMPKHWHEIK